MAISTIDALYNGTSEKLTTSATGITVTGTVAATAYTGDGSALTGVGSPSIDDNGDATAMTIDSSERLLIGKTSTSFSTAGHRIDPDGNIEHIRSNNPPLNLNRKSSDGDIATFYKDGTTVGSVATYGGDLIIGTGDTRLRFVDSLDSLLPVSNSTGSSRDAGIDLGHSETRFKDIYTSGGIYLGAASSSTPVAANKLDDYETGTWTPALNRTGSNYSYNGYQYGTYEKIGNLVVASFTLNLQSISTQGSSYNQLSGLPFTPSAYNANLQFVGSLGTRTVLSSASSFYWAGAIFFIDGNSTPIQTNFTTGFMSGFITYKTAS